MPYGKTKARNVTQTRYDYLYATPAPTRPRLALPFRVFTGSGWMRSAPNTEYTELRLTNEFRSSSAMTDQHLDTAALWDAYTPTRQFYPRQTFPGGSQTLPSVFIRSFRSL